MLPAVSSGGKLNDNPVLDANLACISKYNPNLKYKIMKINSLSNNLSIVNTLLQESNFMYNGFYLHNNYGAEAEAKEIFSEIKNTPLMMHVLFGFGLGYLFQEFALKSEGLFFVYEPDIEILAAALEVVDFTNELSRENVFVFSDFEELKKCYCRNFRYNSETLITVLPSYKKIFNTELMKFVSGLNLVMGASVIDNNYIKNKLVPAIISVCRNIDLLVKEVPLIEYENAYDGKCAVIVSAGPSLDKNIEILKKYRKNAIIFSVGQALRTLINNGITPDFTGSLEANNQMSQYEGIDTSDIDLILEPLTYGALHKSKFRNKISYPSYTSVPNLIWSGFANIDSSKYLSSGTVSYMMLYSAKIMGFKDIVLVGQDLAFIDGKCYTKDARHTGLKYELDSSTNKVIVKTDDFEAFKNSLYGTASTMTDEQKTQAAKRRLENINQNLYFVKGIQGNELPTTYDYASFILQFEDFAKQFQKELNLYNTSLVGAKIENFEDISLEDVLKNKPQIERKSLKNEYKCDLDTIISNIKFELIVIDELFKLLNSAQSLIANYDKEYNNRKSLNENCIRYFKQLLMMYIDMKNTYCQKSRIYMYLQKSYSLDLEYAMKINKGDNPNSINEVYGLVKMFIMSVTKTMGEIQIILKKKVEILNEMSYSKG